MNSANPFPSAPRPHKRIGELNGPWGVLFKVVLVIVPLMVPPIIAWASWATNRIFEEERAITKIQEWQAQAPRFTPTDAENMKLRLQNEIYMQVNARLAEFQNSIEAMRRDVLRTQILMEQHLEQSPHTQAR